MPVGIARKEVFSQNLVALRSDLEIEGVLVGEGDFRVVVDVEFQVPLQYIAPFKLVSIVAVEFLGRHHSLKKAQGFEDELSLLAHFLQDQLELRLLVDVLSDEVEVVGELFGEHFQKQRKTSAILLHVLNQVLHF